MNFLFLKTINIYIFLKSIIAECAVVARGAHNHKVGGSKPPSAKHKHF